MARVLVVEGREHPRAASLFALEGFAVVTALEATEAAEAIGGFLPDVVVIEVQAPSSKVLDLCRLLRVATGAPLALLSSPCPEPEALAAFGVGVDTLVVEPVGDHELIARVRALLRRRPPEPRDREDLLCIGPIRLDTARRELTVKGTLVPLPRREFEIAEVLMRDAGKVVPRTKIVRELWGSMRDTKSLDVQVGRLRTRLTTAGAGQCIVTVRGVGFRFATDEELGYLQPRPLVEIDIARLERTELDCRFEIDLVERTPVEGSAHS